MIRHARIAAAVVAALAASSASVEAASQVNIPTQPIARMTAAYSTKEIKCSSSAQTTLLKRKIKTNAAGNVSAHFQAEFGGASTCNAQIFLKLDGKTVAGPGQIAQGHEIVANSGVLNGEQTNGFVWAVKGVPAGTHTLAVMCLCSESSMDVSEREVIFYHR